MMAENNDKARSGNKVVRMPPTLVLLTIILFIAAVAAQLIPAGSFERQEKKIRSGKYAEESYVVADGDSLESILAKYDGAVGKEDLLETETKERITSVSAGDQILIKVHSTSMRTVVVPGTYQPIERESLGGSVVIKIIGDVLTAPIRGFQDKSSVIGFILILGGAFGIILGTGAIDKALIAAVNVASAKGSRMLLIPMIMILFSAGGAIFGMSEEVIPFVMITIPLALRLGYDAITGLCMSFVAAGLGFAGAFFNPFTVQIAQGIAEIQPISGIGYRLVVWVLVTAIGIVYTMWWADKVRKNPQISPTFETDKTLLRKFAAEDTGSGKLTRRDLGVLLSLTTAIGLIIYGVIEYGWYMDELSGVFLLAGIAAAICSTMSPTRAAQAFVRGASDLVGAALIVAFSAGILQVLAENQVLDTILYWISSHVEGSNNLVAVNVMFFFQTLLNFFVPSGSGQAAMTMPIMAPLSDLIGITRQTAVLAFQFGDGFSNMIIPTSAVTMSVLGIAEIPWEKWARWILPLELILFAFGMIMLTVAVLIGYS